ncbi:MAG TPA: ATP-grasp fold amidoligase family protein [Casimicrobiaceae bacterium]|nr:ATP-grasp fold amidoligase family protein [Casimicrobiaceae bacterium]
MNRDPCARRWREVKLELRRRIAMHWIADRDYLSRLYVLKFGRGPDLRRPTGFNEKILVKILTDRRPHLALFADKLRVRDYVRSAAPELRLAKLYWWSARPDTLPFADLPDAFAFKANHGSGWNVLVERRSDVSAAQLVKLGRRWLRTDFTIVGREWAYRNVHRAVYAEELLRTGESELPGDYKLFVFGGKVRVVQVDRDRFTRHTQVLYDERWNRIDGTVAGLQGPEVPPPDSLDVMLRAAEKLSASVDFVRVDLYDIGGHAYFGELTSSPNKGLSPFRPPSLDAWFGSLLRLDDGAGESLPRYDPGAFSGR